MFSSVSNVLFTKKNGKVKKMWEMNPHSYNCVRKASSRNKLMNKWLTGMLKRCRLPQVMDMEIENHALRGEKC